MASKQCAPEATCLRKLLADRSKIITCPGVYDDLTARIAFNAGFQCLYMTGAGTNRAGNDSIMVNHGLQPLQPLSRKPVTTIIVDYILPK